ncbi:spermatogenesis-associated protein 1 [Electrophorus electricus]|uniref:spermatogenesis-associated protein 1 n=1 Tax=Electrophorus electricus TaxID=8005 RepID=UPI0015D03F62|nr:spermatogenesis-associated protein 1 [Electrophorus electricus]
MSCYGGTRSVNSKRDDQCVELHVFFVPDEQWNSKLNKVSVEAIDSFISAGFIRVYPDINLKAMRDELGALLAPDKATDRYCFLKCVGRSLALVKAKQEKDLKVKSFAPPYSPYPELYLLPVKENASHLCSRSLNPHTVFYNTESQRGYPPFAPGQTKEPTKFPLIKQGPQQCILDQSLEEREEDSPGCEDSFWPTAHNMYSSVQEELVVKQHEIVPINQNPTKMEKMDKKTCYKNITRDSGVPESLEDSDNGVVLSQGRFSVVSRGPFLSTVQRTFMKGFIAEGSPFVFTLQFPVGSLVSPAKDDSAPSAPSLALHIAKNTPTQPTNRDELLKEIRLVKEERKQLARTRQELLRKGKDLLALNRHRRNQARDRWKRKYFDTKKAAAPLEDTLRSLCQELEMFYDKLFQQLQAREGRNRQRRAGKPSSTKNELIIQIMTESCEIDNLKINLDDTKMKLATEMKLRKQAATEMQTLKAELLQKKSQCSSTGPLTASTGLGLHLSTSNPV